MPDINQKMNYNLNWKMLAISSPMPPEPRPRKMLAVMAWLRHGCEQLTIDIYDVWYVFLQYLKRQIIGFAKCTAILTKKYIWSGIALAATIAYLLMAL